MKIRIGLLLMLLWVALPVQAEEKQEAASFWDKLRGKIEQIVPQKKISATTAVGGVRGSKMAADDVYWKGEKREREISAEELDSFNAAMKLAVAGEREKARAAFAEFVTRNPESELKADAEQALAQLAAH